MIEVKKFSDHVYLLAYGEKLVAAVVVFPREAKVHLIAREDEDVLVTKLG
jgi:hypothetical protein